MTSPRVELLRFTTAGSVDDGKSTLIGRLLFDSKAIFADQILAIEAASKRKGLSHIDLSLLTDGLKDEREQGITIDVAYRYFSTPKRSFIIADTPGHVQYTRNMVTGASTANLALILVDARKGMTEQTRRHACIAALLGIPHLVFCINKMDLVEYREDVFSEIVDEIKNFCRRLEVNDIRFIPISALLGDNVVHSSNNLNWYRSGTLMDLLENIHIGSDENLKDCRFPVQTVIRPQQGDFHDYRGYAGKVAGGVFKVGDEIIALPSGFTTRIVGIDKGNKQLEYAFPPMSVTLRLADDLDISRGDMLARPNNRPEISQDLDCTICWFSEKPLQLRGKYIIKHTTNEARCMISEVLYQLDINNLHRNETPENISSNDIARVRIRTTRPIFIDPYTRNRQTGSFILIDEATNNTVAAGMI
jgi:sulfate adenylyltransferase subunit 1